MMRAQSDTAHHYELLQGVGTLVWGLISAPLSILNPFCTQEVDIQQGIRPVDVVNYVSRASRGRCERPLLSVRCRDC